MAKGRQLDGSVVAVIGATGGLGSAICSTLESRGARIVGVNRSGSTSDRSIDLVVDVRDAGAGEEIVSTAVDRHGRLDGIVIASGIVAFGDVADTDDITVEELFLTNSMAPLWIARHAAEALTDSKGFFVNISGVVASTPMPGMAAYSASKAAAAAGLDALQREWRRRKVQVIDAQPPHTETGLATRPLAGTAPDMPEGVTPAAVATRIVTAVEDGERGTLSADSFG